MSTPINLNGINELDLNFTGTTSASIVSPGKVQATYSPLTATSTSLGVVEPDNTTIQISPGGVISAGGGAPSFVQGTESSASSATSLAASISGVTSGHTLLLHVRSGTNSVAPTISSSLGNTYSLIHTVVNSFWTTYTYTYICLSSLPGNETVTATFTSSTVCASIVAEYKGVAGYEAIADNGIGSNANTSNTLTITSTGNLECAVYFFTCTAFSGQTLNQQQRIPSSGTSSNVLMDGVATTAASVIGSVISGAMNQPGMTGLFLKPLGNVQSVGLTMPPDFTVTGSPINDTGVIQVTGGVTKSGVQQNAYSYATDTGAVNAYAVTLSPAPSLVIGSEVIFKAATTNTGAATLTVNGTSYPLTKNGTSALASGDILAGQIISAKFDGTNFQIVVGSSASAGVSSLNTLTGALTISAGTGVTVTPSGGNTLTIAATGGGGSGSLVLLESHTASASTELDFTSSISSTYDEYQVEILGFRVGTSGSAPLLQFSTNGGVTWDTSSIYDWSQVNSSMNVAGSGGNFQQNVNGILLWGDSARVGPTSTATPGLVMSFKIFNPLSTSDFKMMTGQGTGQYNGNGNRYQFTMGGIYRNLSAANAFRIILTSGTITAGTVRCYGIAH